MNIYLVRHTSVAVPRGICYGQSDVPLNERFFDEAHVVKSKLQKIFNSFTPDIVFTSPLSRCSKLAEFCGYSNAIHEPRIMEMNFGNWEMQDYNNIDDPNLQNWYNDYLNVEATGGESFKSQYLRVSLFFDQLKKTGFSNVLIFTHAGVIECAKIYTGSINFIEAFATQEEYGSVIKLNL